ncbi:MAG: heat-inducible transcriptional repressor HrcA, partial [Actinomycetota bacterium]|nr:heat-inducible transcriptional repressor HrcA [Actinomycetota bacterium]
MESSATLGPRTASVLRAVVREHIRSADPVGSGAIAHRYRLGVSPATIRNEMASLEERGYLHQPHTSAGRVPTDLGYRFFVDSLPSRTRLAEAHDRAIRSFFGTSAPDVEELVRRTAHLLSRLTHYAAVALEPPVEESRVVRAELVPVGSAALLLVVGDTGRVDKRLLDAAGETDEDAVRAASDRLSPLAGLTYPAAASRAMRLASAA